MSDSEVVAIRRCERLKWLLFLLCRFPSFTNEFIRKHIDTPHSKPAEIDDYKANSVTAKRSTSSLLVAIYVAWTLKNAYIISVWLSALALESQANNVHEAPLSQRELARLNYSAPTSTLRRVSCFLTNCTRLGPLQFEYGHAYASDSKERLLEDVSRLPLASLCDPWLGQILFRPIMALDAVGVFTCALTIYSYLLLGAWPTIQQTFCPVDSDIIVFVTSPQATANIKRLRVRELLADLSRSGRNFAPPLPALPRRCELQRDDCLESSAICTAGYELEQAVSNCMPATRSEWWRPRLARLFFNTLLGDLLALAEIALAALGFITVQLQHRAQLYARFEHEMQQSNCFIWLERATALEPSHALRPSQQDLSWTVLRLLDGVGLTLLAGLTVGLLMNYYWCIVQELAVWMSELRMLMVASLMATRFQHERERRRAGLEVPLNGGAQFTNSAFQCSPMEAYGLNQGAGVRAEWLMEEDPLIGQNHFVDTSHFYKIPILRQQFEQTIVMKGAWLFERIERLDKWRFNAQAALAAPQKFRQAKEGRFRWHRINSKHKDRDYVERFLAQILFPLSSAGRTKSGLLAHHFDKTQYELETMEQIYVNFRLFCEHVGEQPTTLAISITYLLNYGLVLICVICRRQFPSLGMASLCVMVFACVVANFLIILAADFHAQAKKLQPLVWSLIAQLTFSKDARVQHMRSLWLKLSIQLDEEGGLAMKAFGMRVSYIFIIQLLFWTTTILSLALKPHASEI